MAAEHAAPSPLWGEFALIDTLFAPLAREFPGAFSLKDDAAVFPPKPGHDLVLKTDSVIESVHFLSDDPADTVAQKALRRPLSDLAAKGAEPQAYLLAIALPHDVGADWLEQFAEGLSKDQRQFGIALAGGETNRTPGPLTISITALGWVPAGQFVPRNGANAGDLVWVTGTIGDASAGLWLSKRETTNPTEAAREYLVGRFRVPEPRLAFGKSLRGVATAAIDVSDGLVADLGHIAECSQVRIEIDCLAVPLSGELRVICGEQQETIKRAVSGGDDYEIAFTAPSSATPIIQAESRSYLLPVTRIGRVVQGAGIALLDPSGREIALSHKGYTHF